MRMRYLTVWAVLVLILHGEAHYIDMPSFGAFVLPDMKRSDKDSLHGGVKMGVIDDNCDNGNDHLDVDLAQMNRMVCSSVRSLPVPHCGLSLITNLRDDKTKSCRKPEVYCTKVAEKPIHTCMNKKIRYDQAIPTSGAHRPLWPVYGDYIYLPPQRWIHSLEHGAAVFLYHPCADENQVDILRTLARSCLRRHIITPYNLTREWPFAVLTWTCRLMLDRVDNNIATAIDFIKEKTMKTYESNVYQDGQYRYLLQQEAETVTDKRDSIVCPSHVADPRGH